MKIPILLFAVSVACANAQSSSYVNFIRQNQQPSGVVWDMPIAATGNAPSALALETGGSLFQLWTVNQSTAKDYLLDQKTVGAYMPTADVKIISPDPYALRTRTRVDKGFSVEIQVAGLISGTGVPDAATRVLLEQHIQNYPTGSYTLNGATVMVNSPTSSAYISTNGKTTLNYAASSLKATDPTKASGEEYFVIQALSDGTTPQSQIASASVQVWPVASGAIAGLTPGQSYKYQLPTITLTLTDLYPRSDTYLMLYEGNSVTGTGTIVKSYPMDRDTTQSLTLSVTELDSKPLKDGPYTVALVSTTVYGTELLCNPISFTLFRTMTVNAMQVNYSDGTTP